MTHSVFSVLFVFVILFANIIGDPGSKTTRTTEVDTHKSSSELLLDKWIKQAIFLRNKKKEFRQKSNKLDKEQEKLGEKLNELKATNKDIKLPDTVGANFLLKHQMDFSVVSTKGFWSSLTMIIISELGDKTFFIAAILAMKHSRLVVWFGAAGALFVMTLLAVVFGSVLQTFPVWITHYGAGILFLGFGIKLLYDASKMKRGEASDELREAEEELAKKEALHKKEDSPDLELSNKKNYQSKKNTTGFDIAVLIESFTMTFLSEIGDRSQITTIVLASHKNPYGVALGAAVGHGICTAIAVLGGKLLAARISEKNVTLIGGLIFLGFGIESFIFGPVG